MQCLRRSRSHPRSRFLTAWLVVLSLLCSQLALASYLCPAELPDAARAATRAANRATVAADAMADAMAARMARGEPCNDVDAQQPALCHQHTADAAQSVEALKLPALWAPALLQTLPQPGWPLPIAQPARSSTALALAAPAPPDPLFLTTLRLRV